MKAAIVFHSVCGNGYLIAREFAGRLQDGGVQAALYRVADPAWVEKPDLSPAARENLRAMRAVAQATPQDLAAADLIIMGSPTYFGNVSAAMKAFMDATGGLWIKGALAGKKFAAFTSSGHAEGGGDLCLQALHTYAKYMGMLCAPFPLAVLPGEDASVLGIIHYSNGAYGEALDALTKRKVAGFCQSLAGKTMGGK